MRVTHERLVGPEYMTPVMRVTAGNKRDYRPNKPTLKTWNAMLKAQHSPIRSVVYRFYIFDVPSWVTVHYVRHHVGIQPYVMSQRSNPDRANAPQGELVDMILDINAQALMSLGKARLCTKAAKETREVIEAMVVDLYQGDKYDIVLAHMIKPPCEIYDMCFEPKPCGRLKK